MTNRNNSSGASYSVAPVPQDRREEEAMMRQALAESLGTTSDMINPEQVRQNLGRPAIGQAAASSRRARATSRLPMAQGVFC